MSETKLQTDEVARAHRVPVTLLSRDWTSIITEFKKKYGTHIPDKRLPAQSMFENFAERLADGTLKAEPSSHVREPFRGRAARYEEAGPFASIQSPTRFEIDDHHQEASSQLGTD